MIDMLQGTVGAIGPNSVVILANGVGFRVFVPKNVFDKVIDVGDPIALHTYFSVTSPGGQIAMALYGFANEDDKGLFELLITVNGVGPKLAIAILSTLSGGQLRQAVTREEPATLQRVSGVGKKTAEKIIFELRAKIGADGLSPIAVATDMDRDVVAALTSLGYSVVEAQAALAAIPRGTPEDLNTRIALALQSMG